MQLVAEGQVEARLADRLGLSLCKSNFPKLFLLNVESLQASDQFFVEKVVCEPWVPQRALVNFE